MIPLYQANVKPDSKWHMGSGSIVISDPNQFVPWFLVYAGTNMKLDNVAGRVVHIKTGQTWYDYRNSMHQVTDISLTPEVRQEAKQGVVKSLRESLKHLVESYPTEYSLYLDPSGITGHPDSVLCNIFAGDSVRITDNLIHYNTGGYVVGPGLLAVLENPSYTTLTNTRYNSASLNIRNFKDNFKSQMLIVVQAKYLNYLRACQLTDTPPELPYPAIKLVRTATVTNFKLGTDILLSISSNVLKPKEMLVEFKSPGEINSYLFKPMEPFTDPAQLLTAVNAYVESI